MVTALALRAEHGLALYDIPDEYMDLADAECPECGGEGRITELGSLAEADCPMCDGGRDAERVLRPYIDRLQGEVRDQALALGKLTVQLETEAAVLEAHEDLLARRAEQRRRRVVALKRFILLTLEAGGLRNVKDPFVTVYRQASSLGVDIIDEERVPSRFKRATVRLPLDELRANWPELEARAQVEVLKAEIVDELKQDGVVTPGTQPRRGEHVRVRA